MTQKSFKMTLFGRSEGDRKETGRGRDIACGERHLQLKIQKCGHVGRMDEL